VKKGTTMFGKTAQIRPFLLAVVAILANGLTRVIISLALVVSSVFAELAPVQSQLITPSSFITAIEASDDGVVWITSENDGLYRGVILPEAKDFNECQKVNGIAPRAVYRLSVSNDNLVFVGGASAGVSQIMPDGQVRRLGLEEGIIGEHVFSFADQFNAGLFILTNKSCHYLDRKVNELSRVIVDGDLRDKNICTLSISETNRVLFYTADNRLYDGIFSQKNGVISKATEVECGPLVNSITYLHSRRFFVVGTSSGLLFVKDGVVSSRIVLSAKETPGSEKNEKIKTQRVLSGNYVSALRYDPVRDLIYVGYRGSKNMDIIGMDTAGAIKVNSVPLGEKK
jgi:hypothetical protein